MSKSSTIFSDPLEKIGITNSKQSWNLSSAELSNLSVEHDLAKKASNGAISVSTGEFTGRSPKDRFIVKDKITKARYGGATSTCRLIRINSTHYTTT